MPGPIGKQRSVQEDVAVDPQGEVGAADVGAGAGSDSQAQFQDF